MKEAIFHTIIDLVGDFLYYDRKKDEELPLGAIQEAINNKDVTAEQIADLFRETLLSALEAE